MILLYLIFLMLIPADFSKPRTEVDVLNSFKQTNYILKPEHVDVIYYNKTFINRLEIKTFKYNRTCTAFNVTWNLKFDVHKLDVISQAYKFMSNEYRYFPIHIRFNVCKAMAFDVAGLAKFPCGNFTECSKLKDGKTYKICNFTPNQTKFPPLMPQGQYMVEVQLMYQDQEVVRTRAYASVTVPFAGRYY